MRMIAAPAGADTPPHPPSERGETWPQQRNKTIAVPAIWSAWSRPTFHQPSLAHAGQFRQ